MSLSKTIPFSSEIIGNLTNNQFLWATVLVTLVFLLINIDLLTGNAVAIWDSDGAFVAYQIFVADFARNWKFALWDVWTAGGTPVSGDAQIGAYSPINVILGFIFGNSTLGFRHYWLFLWWLGGMGIMCLGKHFRVPAYGCAAIALGYLFCAMYITHAQHISLQVGFSFLPFIVWRLDVGLCEKRRLPILQAGALWGLAALSAYPGYTILTAFYCGIWIVGRLIFQNSNLEDTENSSNAGNSSVSRKSYIRFLIIALILGTLIGVAIFSPTYFAFLYEGAGTTSRSGALAKEMVLGDNPLHPGAISTFASPFIPVQKIYNSTLWAITDISMTSIYTGGLISVLALFSLANARREKWRYFIGLLGFFALACSLSTIFPFREWLYDLVYPTRFFRHPAIFRAYYLFSITTLALIGMRDLAQIINRGSLRSWNNFKLSSKVLGFAAILVFVTFVNSVNEIGGSLYLPYVHLFLLWGGICLIPYLRKFNKARLIIPVFIVLIAVFDAVCVLQISGLFVAKTDPPLVARWNKLDQEHSSRLDITNAGLARKESACLNENETPCTNLNNDQMIDKIPVFDSYITMVNSFQIEMMQNPVLKDMVIGSDRIWFSPKSVTIAPTLENYTKFAVRTSELKVAPLVIHTPQDMVEVKSNSQKPVDNLSEKQLTELKNSPPLSKISVNVIKYTPEELTFETQSPEDGWLLVTDRWARMWTAEVNNQPAEVFGGNFIFRAIKVSKGSNQISFVYRPISFPYLVILSWGMLFFILLISLYYKFGKDKFQKSKNITNEVDERS